MINSLERTELRWGCGFDEPDPFLPSGRRTFDGRKIACQGSGRIDQSLIPTVCEKLAM